MNTPPPTVAMIQRAVAEHYRVPVNVISEPFDRSSPRLVRHVRARHVAITLAARLTDHSLNRIGDFFGGRDHSSIIYACRKVEERSAKDRRLHNAMRRVTLDLVRR